MVCPNGVTPYCPASNNTSTLATILCSPEASNTTNPQIWTIIIGGLAIAFSIIALFVRRWTRAELRFGYTGGETLVLVNPTQEQIDGFVSMVMATAATNTEPVFDEEDDDDGRFPLR